MNKLRIRLLLSLSGVAIAFAVWHLRLHFPFDDTFISFRYAEHVAAGYGLVWNIGGPPTEGFTNLLLVLVLATARLITSDLLVASQIIGLLATIVTGLTIFSIVSRTRTTVTGLVAAALFWFTPLTWINALSGMETSLFVMLCVLAVSFAILRKFCSATILIFLATLTRPEAAMLGVIIFAVMLPFNWHRTAERNRLLKATFGFIIALCIFALWKWWYFGELLPNSFYVKVLMPTRSVVPGLQYVRLFVTSVLVLIAASLGIRNWRNPAILIACFWAISLLLFYLFVVPLEGLYDRFLWPVLAMLSITAAIGVHDFAARRHLRPLWVFAIIVIAMHIALSVLSPRTEQAFAAHEEVWDASLNPIVNVLRNLPHHDSLRFAYGDAGYVVYKSGINHIDLFGLNDTRMAHAQTIFARAAIVQSERPDVMLLPVYSRDSCEAWVEDAYGLARTNEFVPVATTPAFPFLLVWVLNRNSSYYSDCREWMLSRIGDTTFALHPAPIICYSTR